MLIQLFFFKQWRMHDFNNFLSVKPEMANKPQLRLGQIYSAKNNINSHDRWHILN